MSISWELDKTTAKCKCEPIYDKSDRDKTIDWDGKLIKNTKKIPNSPCSGNEQTGKTNV